MSEWRRAAVVVAARAIATVIAAVGGCGTRMPTQCRVLLRDTGVLPRKEESGGCSGPPSSLWWRRVVAIVIAAIGGLSYVQVADEASHACARRPLFSCGPLAPLLIVACGGVSVWRAIAALVGGRVSPA
jgi:hypothetical protein